MKSLSQWIHFQSSRGELARGAFLLGRERTDDEIVVEVFPRSRASPEASSGSDVHGVADRRKNEFLAMLSHELRSPIASIGYAVRALRSLKGETVDRSKMQSLIERQLQRMTRLVDELLDVSRIANGRLHVQLERVDLRDIVRNAVETAEPDIAGRAHKLAVLLPSVPVWMQADPSRLEQVVVNLLANASKYTDSGGELSISVHVGRQAVIRVRDSGIGIAPKALPRIFDLFEQADASNPRSRSGLGIGLAVVRNLVTLHGGSVTAVSRGIGEGSEFIVRLPLES